MDVNAELARRQQLIRDEGMCGELAPDGSRICILAPGHPEPHPWDETGPLAQQIAHLRRALYGAENHAVLNEVERHVQDMEKAMALRDAGSSSGRTPGFGPGDEGSIPSLAIPGYRSYVQGAWLGVDEAAEKARDALAGPDAQTSGSGSSAADPSAGERQGRQPDPGEIAGLLVELSRWSRVAELNGDLHARIASALAGPDTPAEEEA